MIAIIADDFSGAAELAGIAAARGYRAEVQTVFDPRADAEVIAVDTDTRLKSEAEAVRITGEVAKKVAAARPDWIFKKTDSVLRGHVRVEIEAILDASGLAGCVLIPANPSKGRLIRGGHYSIDNVPLDETLFARDPDHPRLTSNVRALLGDSPRIHTPDAACLEDLELPGKDRTLAAGAADFFAARLGTRAGVKRMAVTSHSLLVCGSLAAWDQGRAGQMRKAGFEIVTLEKPGWPGSWQGTKNLMIAIGRPENAEVNRLTERLAEVAVSFIHDPANLRIGLEGGATALALIRRMGWTRFEVIPEGHPGVGTLRPPGGPVLCVKPGSYPWPDGCL